MSEVLEDSGGALQREEQPEEEQTAEIETDTLFEMLGNERRRYVIERLRELESQTSLSDLARYVAARENETTMDAVTDRETKRVYTSLQQTHLPRMDEARIIDFDKSNGNVSPSQRLTEYTLRLDVVSTSDITVSGVYLALSLASIGLFVLTAYGVGMLAQLPTLGLAAAVTCLFAGVAAVLRFVSPWYTSIQ